jgi:hypothetical protein
MSNGLYNGLDNGLHNGLYNGISNGLVNGLQPNETAIKKNLIIRGLQLSYSPNSLFSYSPNTNTLRDLTTNNYNGLIYNSIPYNPNSKGLVFNGTTHYIKTGLPTKTAGWDYFTGIGEYISTGVWIKYTDSQNGAVLSKRFEGGGYEQTDIGITGSLLFGSNGTKILTITGATAGLYRQILTTNSYNDGKWHYVVLVQGLIYDSLYIDGIFIANSNTVTAVYQTANTTLFLGQLGSGLNPLNALFYKGEIGSFHFYKMIQNPMSMNEVKNNYEALKMFYIV